MDVHLLLYVYRYGVTFNVNSLRGVGISNEIRVKPRYRTLLTSIYIKFRKQRVEKQKEINVRRYYRTTAINVTRTTTRIVVRWTATLAVPETEKINLRN